MSNHNNENGLSVSQPSQSLRWRQLCSGVGMVLLLLSPALCLAGQQWQKKIYSTAVDQYMDSLTPYLDRQNSCCLALLQQGAQSSGTPLYFVNKGDAWSSGIEIPILANRNERQILEIEKLSDGTPLMLLQWDTTDYAAMFNVTVDTPPENLPPEETLEKLMFQNSQLFYSVQGGGNWSSPIAIQGTNQLTGAVIGMGPENNALIVFGKDSDGDETTKLDAELYVSAFVSHQWSTPVRLTSNNDTEYNVQVKFVTDQYLIVWESDSDNDTSTTSDKKIHYATISPVGTIKSYSPDALAVSGLLTAPSPVLGTWKGEGKLLWQSASGQGTTHDLWESRFNGTWSAPVKTSITVKALTEGKLFETASFNLLVVNDQGQMITSVNYGDGWNTGASFLSLMGAGFDVQEHAFLFNGSDTICGGALGAVPTVTSPPADDSNLEATPAVTRSDTLYGYKYRLEGDLAVSATDLTPAGKTIGANATIQFEVRNKGAFPSSSYTLQVKDENGGLREAVQGAALLPGESRVVSHLLNMTRNTHVLEAVVTPSIAENSTDNNQIHYEIRVLPDFTITSVERKNSSTFVVNVAEKQGIAAPVATVGLYLNNDSAGRLLLASKEFDPVGGQPLEFSISSLADRQEPFRLEAVVNEARKIDESDYVNNLGGYTYHPMPDFTIAKFEHTEGGLSILLKNQGALQHDNVSLLVTDNPLLASDPAARATISPLYFQEVSFAGGFEKDIVITLPNTVSAGSFLYGLVNPDGTVQESDRNNNMLKTSTAAIVHKEPSPIFTDIAASCDLIRVCVANNGEAPALATTLSIIGSKGMVVGEKVIPQIDTSSMPVCEEFPGLPPDNYAVRLKFSDKSITGQADLSNDKDGDGIEDSCDPCPLDPINDSDKDQICGLQDNCPDVANHNQSDADSDGTGDACDPQTCGNKIVESPETCDDGNTSNGDGCTSQCFADGDLDGNGIVDRLDALILNSLLNKPASVNSACDLNLDGKITILDSRKLTLLCTYPNCASQTTAPPTTVPGKPTIGTATAGNRKATITFTPPADSGGSEITGYTVTVFPGGKKVSGPGSPLTVTGLVNGRAYTFTVRARNAVGIGAASARSNSVTPATVPARPIIGTATAGNGQATVTFTPPASNGGSPITGYTVISSPGGGKASGLTSPLTVKELANGKAYTFTVKATNVLGTGAASAKSNSVVPAE